MRIADGKQIMASLLPSRANASLADEELGHLLLQRLKKDNLFFEVTPTDNDEEAFWSDDVQRHVNNIRDEAAFDTFITPCLNATLGSCDLVFINSQRYRCLPLSPFVATALKPYGFATHRGMFRAKPAPNDEVLRPDGFRFGVAEEELFDCLVLFERKLTITAAAFGQVARYLQNFRPNESATAILFHLHSFWLVTSYESVVVKVQVAQWTNKGSKSLFQNFITDNISPWVAHLSFVCRGLGVNVVEGDAFLGRGANGRVFKVTRGDGELVALKPVNGCSVERLYREKLALANAEHTGLTARAVGGVFEAAGCGAFGCGALLISPVGKSSASTDNTSGSSKPL